MQILNNEELTNKLGALSEDLNNKVDLNQLNTNTAGKSFISGMGMPSTKYVDLTLGASGTTYTAPANGWFTVIKALGINNGTFNFRIKNANNQEIYTIGSIGGVSTDGVRLLFPVKKNDICSIAYSCTGDTQMFRFIYAEGEQPQT